MSRSRRGRLPASVPLAGPFASFRADPLRFLDLARRRHGNLFAIRRRGPLFSRAAGCTGVVAVFGTEQQRAVLSDLESFAMPMSAARVLKLPRQLVNLTRGLHAMQADQHAEHRLLLGDVLRATVCEDGPVIASAVEEFARRWSAGTTIQLLKEMRELTLLVASRLLFGGRDAEPSGPARLMDAHFQLRRAATAPESAAGTAPRRALIQAGLGADALLRRLARRCPQSATAPPGLLARLVRGAAAPRARLSLDNIVGHVNVLFVSLTEPIAVSLAWILLVLSQLPELRDALRRELRRLPGLRPAAAGPATATLLDSVIYESLRLLPPNALMVRVTTRPAVVGGVELPESCEIVLCPFLSHRDADCFPEPHRFLPERWSGSRPSGFSYFPFGAGGRACVGHALAMSVIRTVLSVLVARHDLVLDGDQAVDWRLHIQFMPRHDPAVVFRTPAHGSAARGGVLRGPVATMLDFATPPTACAVNDPVQNPVEV